MADYAMTHFVAQESAIEDVLDELPPDGVIHVYGNPEGNKFIGDPRVLFHPQFQKLSGFFVCTECGVTDGPEA